MDGLVDTVVSAAFKDPVRVRLLLLVAPLGPASAGEPIGGMRQVLSYPVSYLIWWRRAARPTPASQSEECARSCPGWRR